MTTTIDYDELSEELLAVQAGVRASESHGFLCGHFCSSNSVERERWQDHLLAGIDDAADMEDCLSVLTDLARQVADEIVDQDMPLTILLPSENSTVSERSAALAEWCGGFVSGLGIGGIGEQSTISDDCDEFIRDVVSLSRMDTAVEDSEAAESDLMELIEYLRVGVIMLHQECYLLTESGSTSEAIH